MTATMMGQSMTKLTINRKPKGIYGTPQKTTQAAQKQDKTTSAHKVMPGKHTFLMMVLSALRMMKDSITLNNTICGVMPGWQFVCCAVNSAMLQVIILMNLNHGARQD